MDDLPGDRIYRQPRHAGLALDAVFELIRRGRLQPERLVEKTISLDDAPAAFEAMGRFEGLGITVIDRFK